MSECPICYEVFGGEKRLPKILTKCGHTICKDCVGKLLDECERVECPSCRLFTKVPSEGLPTNFGLLGTLGGQPIPAPRRSVPSAPPEPVHRSTPLDATSSHLPPVTLHRYEPTPTPPALTPNVSHSSLSMTNMTSNSTVNLWVTPESRPSALPQPPGPPTRQRRGAFGCPCRSLWLLAVLAIGGIVMLAVLLVWQVA